MTAPTIEPLAVSLAQAAEALGISRAYAYRLADAGDIPTVRLGRRRVVPVHALRALVGAPTPTAEEVAP